MSIKHHILPGAEFPEGSFLLSAPPGRGKTYWLNTLASAAAEAGVSHCLISARRHGQVPETFLKLYSGSKGSESELDYFSLNPRSLENVDFPELVLIDDAYALGALHNFPTFAPTLRYLGKRLSSKTVIAADSYPDIAEKVLNRMGIYLPIVHSSDISAAEISAVTGKNIDVEKASTLCGNDLALLKQLSAIWPVNSQIPDAARLHSALNDSSSAIYLHLALHLSSSFGLARGDGLLRYALTILCRSKTPAYLPDLADAIRRGKPTVRNLFLRLSEVGLCKVEKGKHAPPHPLLAAWIRIHEGGDKPDAEELMQWLVSEEAIDDLEVSEKAVEGEDVEKNAVDASDSSDNTETDANSETDILDVEPVVKVETETQNKHSKGRNTSEKADEEDDSSSETETEIKQEEDEFESEANTESNADNVTSQEEAQSTGIRKRGFDVWM